MAISWQDVIDISAYKEQVAQSIAERGDVSYTPEQVEKLLIDHLEVLENSATGQTLFQQLKEQGYTDGLFSDDRLQFQFEPEVHAHAEVLTEPVSVVVDIWHLIHSRGAFNHMSTVEADGHDQLALFDQVSVLAHEIRHITQPDGNLAEKEKDAIDWANQYREEKGLPARDRYRDTLRLAINHADEFIETFAEQTDKGEGKGYTHIVDAGYEYIHDKYVSLELLVDEGIPTDLSALITDELRNIVEKIAANPDIDWNKIIPREVDEQFLEQFEGKYKGMDIPDLGVNGVLKDGEHIGLDDIEFVSFAVDQAIKDKGSSR